LRNNGDLFIIHPIRTGSKWNKSFVIFFAANIYQIEKLKSCIYQI